MGDSKRFNLFADCIKRNLSKSLDLVDVAAGKGYLQIALRERGFNSIESWDKRSKKQRRVNNKQNWRYQWFDYRSAPDHYEAVVAMHPDEGTDHAILYAAKQRVPAIICPCCIKPSASAFWEKHNYNLWIKHLVRLANKANMEVQRTVLKMNGKNDVLIIRP